MTVLITLTTAGTSTGPFNLYSDVDAFATPFETGVAKSVLVAGYNSTVVPDGSTIIYVLSTGTCNTGVYLNISGVTTTTTTTSSTTTTTTTPTPFSCLTGDTNAIATCSGGDASQFTIAPGYTAVVTPGGYYYSGTGTRYYYAYIYDSTNSTMLYSLTYTQTGSTPGTWTTFGSGNALPEGTYYLHLNTVNCSTNGSGTFSLQVGDCQAVEPPSGYYYYDVQRYDCGLGCEPGTTAVARNTNFMTLGYFYKGGDGFVYEILNETTGSYYNVDLYGAPSRETCGEACSA